jgi:hypothetical protein
LGELGYPPGGSRLWRFVDRQGGMNRATAASLPRELRPEASIDARYRGHALAFRSGLALAKAHLLFVAFAVASALVPALAHADVCGVHPGCETASAM